MIDQNFSNKEEQIIKETIIEIGAKQESIEKIMKEGIPKKGHYINVPGLWSSLNDPYKKGKKLTLGHGTYILKVKGLKSKGKVGFVLPYFATAFKSYIIQGNKIYNLLII